MADKTYFTTGTVALSTKEPTPFKPNVPSNLDYVPFGIDNLFPQALALFARTSPNHRGVVNSKVRYCKGSSIVAEDKWSEGFVNHCNAEGETLHGITGKILLDEIITGNRWIEIITDAKRSFIYLNHLDATKCRRSKDGLYAIMHPDWQADQGKADRWRIQLPLYPNFEPDNSTGGRVWRSVYHGFEYEPEYTFYGLPSSLAGKDAVQIDLRTNKWNLARLVNSFRLSGILFVPVADETEGKQVMANIKRDYIGEDNQGKLLIIPKGRSTGAEKPEQPQLLETKQEDSGSWLDLHKQSLSDIVIAHGWFRSLTGIADNTGFDTQRILNEYAIALNTVITETQERYSNIYRQLVNGTMGKPLLDFNFVNKSPIDTDRYYKVWELRQRKGLDYDETDPAQQQIILT